MLGRKERETAERVAKRLWDGLDTSERHQLGDDLVFGCFDWGEWFERKPPRGTVNALDRMRLHWEIMTDG